MADSSSFELLEVVDDCDVSLPVNTVRDDYNFSCFAPLVMIEGGVTGPAVLPRDLVEPQFAMLMREQAPDVSLSDLKGGFALIPEWREAVSLPPPGLAAPSESVPIANLNEFLSSPTVRLRGIPYDVALTPRIVRELLTTGQSVVSVGKGDTHRVVRLDAPREEDGRPIGQIASPIIDLYAFLSERRIHVDSAGTYDVELTPRNIEELTTDGVTRAAVVSGEERRLVYMATAEADPATASAGAGLAASEGRRWTLLDPFGDRPRYDVIECAIPIQPQTLFPTFPFVFHLPYRQTWKLLGYSRGALLNSISLAPQEETTIEVFTWDRLQRLREEVIAAEQESSMEGTFNDKDSWDVLKEATKERNWTLTVGGDVKIPLSESVNVGLRANSETRESLRNVDRSTRQTVTEAVLKATSRIKSSRQTKISETQEIGREMRVTRMVRNPNMCSTLNMDYFEILATYEITTELLVDQVRLCVLVDNPIPFGAISTDFLPAFEGALRPALLSPEVYTKGFAAARSLAASRRFCDVKCAPACRCDAPPAASPGSAGTGTTAGTQIALAGGAVIKAIRDIQAASPNALCALANGVTIGDENVWAAARTLFHRWLYARLMELIAPRWWAACRELLATTTLAPDAAERFLGTANAQLGDVLNVATLQVRFFVKAAEIVGTLFAAGCWNIPLMTLNIAFDDAGLDSAIAQLRNAVDAYKAVLPAGPPANGAAPPAAEQAAAIVPAFPPRELAEALVDEYALLQHLAINEAYYRGVMWQALSESDRYLMLEGLRGLMPLVENDAIGFVGNQLALPVRTQSHPNLQAWFEGNVLENAELRQAPAPIRVTVPTPGVTLETRLGQCGACENFIETHRTLDLQQKTAEVSVAEQRVAQEELETERYQARLNQTAPLLDDPDPYGDQDAIRLAVKLEQEI